MVNRQTICYACRQGNNVFLKRKYRKNKCKCCFKLRNSIKNNTGPSSTNTNNNAPYVRI